MNGSIRTAAISPLRQRLIDDMNMRWFSRETQRNYIRDVGRFATFLGRSLDTATADDLRGFQIEQRDAGMPTPTMNSIVSALRFFFTHTVDRPDLGDVLEREINAERTDPVTLGHETAPMRPMYAHYDQVGLMANPLTLRAILDRPPRTLGAFFQELAGDKPGS
jgi:integrase/recombinase XerD